MSLYSRLDRLAADVAKLDRKVDSVSNAPQAQRTSIEAGTLDVNDEDGNLVSTIGLQEDGSGATRFFDGPVPPVPAGFTALADGPVIQGTWDGTFVDGQQATYDLAYLEVAATLVDDDSRVSFATITAKEGASASVVANQSGQWAVAVRSVSQAGKKSEFASAGTVEVKLVDLAGAIEAVQDSANGKNKVTYSSHAPTPDDPGIFDDTWFVGQVGRPEDIIEVTNLWTGSALSKNRSSIASTTSGSSAEQTDTGLRITTGPTPTGAYSLIYTTSSGYVVPEPNKVYSWRIPIKNYGPSAMPVRATAWLRDTSNATYSSASDAFVLESGEQRDIVIENMASGPSPQDLRFSLYYSANVSKPVQGTQFELLDGITVTATASAQTSFNGDTPSGETDNESHYRWTGEPYASTSEKYLPALDIGDADNWNVIEQYRHDGTGWVKVELSHYVFSTVDLGKATVGELDGIRIMAKTIGTEQLRADFADFVVARGMTIIAGNDRSILNDAGFAIFDENGDRRTYLSPDGSTFKGEVEAETLVVNEGAEFKANNTLAQGAKLTLAAGVTDPTAPPTVQPFWDGLEFENPADVPLLGLAWDGTNYWTVGRSGWWEGSNLKTVLKINATTGATESFYLYPTGGSYTEFFGVTCIGSELFFLYRTQYTGRVVVTDLNCVEKRKFDFEDMGYSATNPLTYKPGIGNDGTNVVIAHAQDNGTLRVRTFNKTTGVITKNVAENNTNFKGSITGVYIGSADDGTARIYVNKVGPGRVYAYNTNAVSDGTGSFDTATASAVGVAWADGKFRTLDPSGIIHEYADINMGDETGDWWATYRWSIDENDDGYNDYTSRIGPSVRFTWPRRSKLKFIGAPLPQGVGYISPSIAKKTTKPTRADFRTPNWSVREGTSVAWYNTLPTDWQSGSAPSDTNDFPSAEPSVLESASATFQVKGDGSGRWGPLTISTAGKITSGLLTHASGEVSITPTGSSGTRTGNVYVTFPAGRFSVAPKVVVSALTSVPGTTVVGVGASGVTTSGFTAYLARVNNTTTPLAWIAMEEG